MNRRDMLKALSALPVVSALEGCMRGHSIPPPPPSTETKIHTLQILLEGAFAVVLQRQSNRLTAFVPLSDPSRKDLVHHFCFNDPGKPKEPGDKRRGFRFELSGDGLHNYYSQDSHINPYINPGFSDFSAETEKWIVPPSLVVLDLPFPRSINFSGRPLNVKFGKNALKPTGMMPTNYVLEYRVDEEEKVKLKCNQADMDCSPSPHCPPGVRRYFFGVGPTMYDPKGRQQHAVDFFNFILQKAFPELREKYELVSIEPSDYEEQNGNVNRRPANFNLAEDSSPALVPAVLNSDGLKARLLPVASLVDCQVGGIIVNTRTAPNG
jgi:hypothetical protein